MICLSFYVSVWLIFLELFYASEVFSYADDLSEHRSFSTMVAINAVQPIDLRQKVSALDLQKQVLRKLKEIFFSQFPDGIFSLNKYRIENWPLNVNISKMRWNKREIREINERLPFYRFYAMKNYQSLQQMKSSVSMKNEMSRSETLKFLLERFKAETGRINAYRIEWKMLDRREIPKKYDNISFDGNILFRKSICENREIVDNIHFFNDNRAKQQAEASSHNITWIENDTDHYNFKDIDESARASGDHMDQPIVEFSEIELECLHTLFSKDDVSFDQSDNESETYAAEDNAPFQKTITRCDTISPITRRKAYFILLKRYREESGNYFATRIRWDRLDRRAIPAKYNDIKINHLGCTYKFVYRTPEIFDNIHFFANDPNQIERSSDISNSEDSNTLHSIETDINQSIETDNASEYDFDSFETEFPELAEMLGLSYAEQIGLKRTAENDQEFDRIFKRTKHLADSQLTR